MSQLDMLNQMFSQQREFMNLLKEKRNFPEFPVDLSTKQGQKFVKSISHECMHELFESVQLLSDSKDHKNSLSGDFNKEKFLEELADVTHYLIEIFILTGISPEQIYEAYMKKGEINNDRINNGY
jgi:hypothetical protein